MKALEMARDSRADGLPRSPEAIVEIPVLLESWLLTSLEQAASAQGMTTGNMVRRLIRDFLYYAAEDLHSP